MNETTGRILFQYFCTEMIYLSKFAYFCFLKKIAYGLHVKPEVFYSFIM